MAPNKSDAGRIGTPQGGRAGHDRPKDNSINIIPMRDVVAAIIATLFVFFALRLATSLTRDRRKRRQERVELETTGQSILAEIPSNTGITFFTEDATAFHFGQHSIAKTSIIAARVLINGAPIAVSVRAGAPVTNTVAHDIVEEQSESLTRDRWDVAIDTNDDTVMVPCGAIRERISQELARCIFAALKNTLESPK